jgi:acetyltransferase-like isoleucine patch superfamily enzyme
MILRLLAKVFINCRRGWRGVKRFVLLAAFAHYGKNFRFDPDGTYSFQTIEVGDDVYIGPGACFQASQSGIKIGSKVIFGPNVTIRGGNHNTSVVGRFMADVKEKRPEDDQVVVIEDDVWVATGVIILKGVHLGRGCIVAAGAVVNRSVPPYAVVAGVPAKVISFRFDVDTIIRHEEMLYPPEKRYSKEYLEEIQKN